MVVGLIGLFGTSTLGSTDAPEQTAETPTAPRLPLFTPDDVLIASDAALTLPDSLPLTPHPPAPAPAVNGAPYPDSGRVPMARAGAVVDTARSDSTRRMAAAERDAMSSTARDSLRAERLAQLAEALSDASASAPQQRAPRTPPPADASPSSSFASAVAGTIPEDAGDGPGITGLVTDETQTKIGRDFYDAFYDRWTAPEKDYYYTVVVTEQPMPSLGTRVVVRVNQNVVFQTRLQPRRDIIEQAARRAVYMTQRRLQSNLSINAY